MTFEVVLKRQAGPTYEPDLLIPLPERRSGQHSPLEAEHVGVVFRSSWHASTLLRLPISVVGGDTVRSSRVLSAVNLQ